LVGVLIVGAILYYIGIEEILKQISRLGWRGFALFILSVVMTFIFWTLGWIVIMRGYKVKIPFISCLGARIGSYAVSYLTPSMHFGGEPVRALIAQRKSDSSYRRIFATIATERITTAIALIFFIILGAFQGITSQLPANTLSYMILVSLIFTALLVLLVLNFVRGYFIFSGILVWLEKIVPWKEPLEKAEKTVRGLEEDINVAFSTNIKQTLLACLLNIVATFFMYIRPQIFFYFSQGKLLSFSQLSIIFALIALLSSFLWITPGGLGIAEGGYIGIFALVGAQGSDAVAFSLSIKIVELFFVGLGLSLMARYGILGLLFRKKESRTEE